MTSDEPTDNSERINNIERRVAQSERRVSQGEAERDQMLKEMQRLWEKFDRHEERVMIRMEQGNEWMRQMNENVTKVTVSFESFVEWFKFAFKWTMITVIGVIGPAVTAMGIYLSYFTDK